MSAAIPLLASAVQTGSGTQVIGGGGQTDYTPPVGRQVFLVNAMCLQLRVTASSVPTTLDVFVQHSLDGGSTWDDFIHFTTVGAVATNRQIAQWYRDVGPATAVHAAADGTLASGTVLHGPTGGDWRIKWVLVGTSYTFSVVARQLERVR